MINWRGTLSGLLCAVAALIILAGCGPKNVGNRPLPTRGPVVTVIVPANMNGGWSSIWGFSWTDSIPPYTISIDMGGGAMPNEVLQADVTSPFSYSFTMLSPSMTDSASYTVTVTVIGGAGLGRPTEFAYTVSFGHPLGPPSIDDVTFDNGILRVYVSDPDGDRVWVTLQVPTGLSIGPGATQPAVRSFTVEAVEGVAEFRLWTTNLFAGYSGNVTIIAMTEDEYWWSDSVEFYVPIPGIPLAPDTIYAIPLSGASSVGANVGIVVVTGVPANPFQFMNGVGLTVNDDADYVSGTFNAGAVGGAAGDIDGIWSAINPAGGILLAPDSFIVATDIGGGRERWDFNLTPIGGSDQTTASGELFNFEFTFSAAGTKTLGFQAITGIVSRTYYTDSNAVPYNYWGTLHADETGALNVTDVPNSIVVE